MVTATASDTVLIQWKPGYRKASLCPAEQAYVALEEIRLSNGGVISPVAVVSVVESDPGHVLRPLFEWDDRKAAVAHRLEQARGLIRSIAVIRPESKESDRQYQLEITSYQPRESGYRTTEDVFADPVAKAELFKRAWLELTACHRKYRRLTELNAVWEAIESVMPPSPIMKVE
jgi:hypothetical protein